ncbi:hypothetical protein [Pyrococcus kukulkanii]|uniref:Uncharacterized protein n=1 Tax=Pyrococcus kukulkanii TaxID=1609559 RepID=A0ABV4T5F6_9EURY
MLGKCRKTAEMLSWIFEKESEANPHDDLWIEIRLLAGEGAKKSRDIYNGRAYYYKPNDLPELFNALEKLAELGYNVYYGAHLRKENKWRKASGKENVVDNVRVFYVDVDVYHDRGKIKKFIEELGVEETARAIMGGVLEVERQITEELVSSLPRLEPFAVVYTGYGVQYLFISDQPVKKEEFERLQEGLIGYFMSIVRDKIIPPKWPDGEQVDIDVDIKVKDVARILRLPCSVNVKVRELPLQAEVLSLRYDAFVDITDLKRLQDYRKLLVESKKAEHEVEVSQEELDEAGKILAQGLYRLSPEEKNLIRDFFAKMYYEGVRHCITLHGSWWLIERGVCADDIEEIFKWLFDHRDDDPREVKNDRVRALRDNYIRRTKKSGIYGLKTSCIKEAKQRGYIESEEEMVEELQRLDEMLRRKMRIVADTDPLKYSQYLRALAVLDKSRGPNARVEVVEEKKVGGRDGRRKKKFWRKKRKKKVQIVD